MCSGYTNRETGLLSEGLGSTKKHSSWAILMSSFFANTTKLLGGNIFAQLIGILAIPIITRLYSTDQFGSFSIILSAATIIASVSTLGFHLAILIPKERSQAKALAKIALICLLLTSLPLSIIAVLFPSLFESLLGNNFNHQTVHLITLMVICQGLYSVVSYWCIRERQFGAVATSKIFESIFDRGMAVGAGAFGWTSALSLSVARVLGIVSSLGFLVLSIRNVKNKQQSSATVTSKKSIYCTFQEFKEYAIYNTPSVLLINAMGQLPTIMIGYFYSPIAAGLYAIANRLVSIPVQALGSALSTTVTQHFASMVSNGDLKGARKNAISMHTSLFAFLLIPFSFICITGEYIVELLLGPQWLLAGNLVQWMSYFAFSTLMAQAFGGLFDVMKRQKVRLTFHIINFIFRIGTLLICGYLELPILTTIASFAVVANIMNLIAVKLAFDGIGAKKEILTSIARNIAPPLCLLLCAWELNSVYGENIKIIFSLFYCLIWLLALLHILYRKECIAQLRKIKKKYGI